MAHRCHHGHIIQDSWMECPECCEEHDIREASYAAQDALIEAKRQTKILEDLADQRERESERETARSKSIEAQELARLAEERFRMNDLRGAVQLITQAIEIQPTFVSFYLQRARYFACQDKKDQAISDLRYSFKTDKEVLLEIENQLKTGKLSELISLKPDLENLIREFKDSARKAAIQSKSQVESGIKSMRLKFSEKPLPDFVEEVEREFREIVKLIENDLYFDLLNVPKLAEGTKNKAAKAIERKNDVEKQARESLLQVEQRFQAIFSSRVQEFASNEVQEVQTNLQEAKRLFQTQALENFQKSIEFSRRAITATDVISRKIDSEKQAREFLSQAEQRLQISFSSQVLEFAPNEIKVVQSNIAEAKQLYQTHISENYLKCNELSKKAINEIQRAENITQQALAIRQTKRAKKRKITLALSGVVILISILFIFKIYLDHKYQQAKTYTENGEWEKAQQTLKGILWSSYKSEEKKSLLGETYRVEALAYLEKKNVKQAEDLLINLKETYADIPNLEDISFDIMQRLGRLHHVFDGESNFLGFIDNSRFSLLASADSWYSKLQVWELTNLRCIKDVLVPHDSWRDRIFRMSLNGLVIYRCGSKPYQISMRHWNILTIDDNNISQDASLNMKTELSTSFFIECFAISNDGVYTAFAGRKGNRHIVLIGKGKRIVSIIEHNTGNNLQDDDFRILVFSPKNQLGVATRSGKLTVYDVDGSDLGSLEFNAENDEYVGSIAFSSSGELLACATRNKLALIELRTKKVISHNIWNKQLGPARVAFSPDGRFFAASSHYGIIYVWHWPSLKPKTILIGGNTQFISFSSDGHFLASGRDDNKDKICIWAL
jgi:WD40 repeat protein